MDEFCDIVCCSCGVHFKVEELVRDRWKKFLQQFFCPNGHGQRYLAPKLSVEQEKIDKLTAENEELKKQLEVALKNAEQEKVRANGLVTELEVWAPRKEAS